MNMKVFFQTSNVQLTNLDIDDLSPFFLLIVLFCVGWLRLHSKA
jgi:hypothetical protein